MAALQAEVAYLRDHKERCEHATLSLLRELLQVRGRLQLQDSELKRLQLLIQAPEKEMLEVGELPGRAAVPQPAGRPAQPHTLPAAPRSPEPDADPG